MRRQRGKRIFDSALLPCQSPSALRCPLLGRDMRVVQLRDRRYNQRLNLLVGLVGRYLVGAERAALGVAPAALSRDAQPAVGAAGAHKDHFPLARRQQVANDEVVLVAVEAGARLVHQQRRVRLELVAGNHALGRPPVDEVLEKLGHGVEVHDEPLGARHARRVKVVKRLLLLVGPRQRARRVRGLDLVLGHALRRHEEVGHGGRQVQQAGGAERPHEARQPAQLVQVVANGDKREQEQHVVLAGLFVLAQHGAEARLVAGADHDARVVGVLLEEVQEAVLGVRVVPRVRLQAELAVQEDDGVPGAEKVLGRRGAARARAEVVDEPHRLLLQRHRRPARRDEHDPALRRRVGLNKGPRRGEVRLEVPRRRVRREVGVLGLD
ncbi:hypothetical protein CCM_03597 [Cordyceps militaris CM01]|uniref:Uncharacterized protein n=1 Tax=Cordyceps militaris (strain CM01) TaxID=983644 RepID=G3JBM0_CORMM|nr:uncharacterized protein CCM_03597 [Cordyceps militaris CM01]EGX95325.1 hypothetical protein CCM_03597 [Cordyceps militaris CM01]